MRFITVVLGSAVTITAFSFVSNLTATPEQILPLGTVLTGQL